MTAGSKQANWRGGLAVLLALATCLPVVMARYPQMSDYPAHLARYAVMLDAMRGTGPSADLARYYGFQWAWTGNLGVDLLIRPFAALFGLEGGGRVIAGLIPPLTGLGLLAVDKVLRGHHAGQPVGHAFCVVADDADRPDEFRAGAGAGAVDFRAVGAGGPAGLGMGLARAAVCRLRAGRVAVPSVGVGRAGHHGIWL